LETQNPQGLQDGAKAHSLVKLKLQPSQATLSYRVAYAYFLKTLQIIASGFIAFLLLCKKIIVICQLSFAEL